MNKINKFIKDNNKLLVIGDQMIVSGSNFVLGLVLIRTLGLEAYGLFTMLWMGVLFALSMHQAFITKPLMTLAVGKTTGAQRNYFNTLWLFQLGIGGLSLVSITAFVLLGNYIVEFPEWVKLLPIMVLLATSYLLQDFIKKTFFIQGDRVKPLMIDSGCYGFIFISLLVLAQLGESTLQNSLWVLLGGFSISTLLGCKSLFKKDNQTAQPAWRIIIKKHYHFSNWLLGTSVLQWFSGNFFLITAASTMGTTAVGAVRIGQNIVGLCHVLFLAMENIVPTEAAQFFLQKGKKGLIEYLKTNCKKMGVIVFLTLLMMAMAAPILIQTFYGASFVTYSYVVWGYCLLYFFVFFGYPARYFFRTIQFTKPIFIAYCVSAAFSLAIAFPIVQAWGITGVLAGLILSQIVTLLVYVYFLAFFDKLRGRFDYKLFSN